MLTFALLAAVAPVVLSFSFSYTNPISCDPLTVFWSGGTPPFTLNLVPSAEVARDISIPSYAWSTSSQTGNYNITLPLSTGTSFLMTMSDAAGFGTGGTTDILIAEPSSSGSSCNTSAPTSGFWFSYGYPAQCQPVEVFWDANATAPVSFWGLIPHGEVFRLVTPSQGASYDWTVNMVEGTTFYLIAYDGAGNPGASSPQINVLSSNTSACIDASSPSSTTNPGPYQTSISSTAAPLPSAPASSGIVSDASGGTYAGVIAGAVVGAIGVLAMLVLVLVLYRRRRRHPSGNGGDGMVDSLMSQTLSPLTPTQAYEPIPFLIQPVYHHDSGEGSWDGANTGSRALLRRGLSDAATSGSSTISGTSLDPTNFISDRSPTHRPPGALSKRPPNLALAQARPRYYLLHTDAGRLLGGTSDEESAEGHEEDEVVELPPAYEGVFADGRRSEPLAPQQGQDEAQEAVAVKH